MTRLCCSEVRTMWENSWSERDVDMDVVAQVRAVAFLCCRAYPRVMWTPPTDAATATAPRSL